MSDVEVWHRAKRLPCVSGCLCYNRPFGSEATGVPVGDYSPMGYFTLPVGSSALVSGSRVTVFDAAMGIHFLGRVKTSEKAVKEGLVRWEFFRIGPLRQIVAVRSKGDA